MVDKEKDEAEEVYYVEPTSKVDLARRLENDFEPERVAQRDPAEVNAPYATETTDTTHYLGVSPEYMTHADVSTQPFAAEGGPEAEALERLKGQSAVRKVVPPESHQTLGGGSRDELVYSATSGEGYTAEFVDEEKEEKPEPKKSQAEKKTAPPVPSGEQPL